MQAPVMMRSLVVARVVAAVPMLAMLPTTMIAVATQAMMKMVLVLWLLVSTRCSLPELFFLPVRPCELVSRDGYNTSFLDVGLEHIVIR